jgi:L-lactate dehydrogenase complex protein LldE
MTSQRESPIGKPVSLFVTCIVDMVYPDTGMSVVTVLEHLGIAVDFPTGQTCCGQPAFNSGYRDDARAVAKTFLRAFESAQVILTPSGSCAAMIRHEYPALFADDPVWRAKAEHAASITWEFSEFLVDGLGITDLGARLSTPRKVALHHGCHGLRLLGLGTQTRVLADSVQGVEVVDGGDPEECCGFGGLFAVKMPDISTAMLQRKLSALRKTGADSVLTGDCSCLTQINGGLSRVGDTLRACHIADLLADGLSVTERK